MGGPDDLSSQHLKDMTEPPAGEGGPALISSLASFVNMVLNGEVLVEVYPVFFGANLIALQKKGEGCTPLLLVIHSVGWLQNVWI